MIVFYADKLQKDQNVLLPNNSTKKRKMTKSKKLKVCREESSQTERE